MKKIILIICVLFLSCTKENKFEANIISQGKNSFWIKKVVDVKGDYIYINSQVIFLDNYKMMSFNSFDENKLGNRSIINLEASNEESWSYDRKDSIFKICAVCIYKIDKYSRDTIFMKNKDNGEKFVLIKKRHYGE